ncbi:MAG: universal stress protein [Acidimicrobiia bacterium]|nr:universal stress protein [Acidimicrobiia bacterium]NNC74995.1 universal stress protein [Acidimicrobiia bacterium]
MKVVVATDGTLDPEQVAGYVVPLAASDTVHVLTVVEVPRRLLADLRAVYGEQPAVRVDRDAEYVSPSGSGVPPQDWPGDDAMIDRYLSDKLTERTAPMVDAITAAGGNAAAEVVESENSANSILEQAKELGADLICIGAHGQGVFEGLLGSVGTKVVRRAHVPVLLIH